MKPIVVGLLSDTHIPYRLPRLPQEVIDAFEGVDVILHAGDVDVPQALTPLRRIAPVHAVRGNVHVTDFSDGGAEFPAEVRLELAGVRIVLTHAHQPGLLGFVAKGFHVVQYWLGLTDNERLNRLIVPRLVRAYPEADVIVFGHSHAAHVEWVDGTLLINPGAVSSSRGEEPTVARMTLGEGRPKVEFVSLSDVG